LSKSSFDPAARRYEADLERGVRLSGESAEFFARRRVEFLARKLEALGARESVRAVLDYGCGTGMALPHLLREFPGARIVGADASEEMIREARRRLPVQPGLPGPPVRLEAVSELTFPGEGFDLILAANVFHHIEPAERPGAVRKVRGALRPGGILAVFENNSWNPGARAVMARVPFDRGTSPLSPLAARKLLRSAGLELVFCGSLFYFPRFLAFLRFLEPALVALPLGAQLALLGRRSEGTPSSRIESEI
jgi:SAM-dependent methyltransferase